MIMAFLYIIDLDKCFIQLSCLFHLFFCAISIIYPLWKALVVPRHHLWCGVFIVLVTDCFLSLYIIAAVRVFHNDYSSIKIIN